MKVLNGLFGLLLVIAFCFALGAGFGACRAGAAVTYRLLSGGRT